MKTSHFFKKTILCIGILFIILESRVQCQEPSGSSLYYYYKDLELINIFSSNTLNFHTFTFNTWDMTLNSLSHPWSSKLDDFDLSKSNQNDFLRIIPFQQIVSFNSKYPRGFNDGPAWQGKGWNGQLFGGLQLSQGNFSLTMAPILWFSQNQSFPLVPSVHESTFAAYIPNIDLPQRFGDSPLIQFDPGESEIRYTGRSFTVGFGTQSIWLGPTFFNAIILSNNAGGFPKFDLGIKKFYTNYGFIEGFFFLGLLKSSSFVDSQIKEKDRYISGYTLSYAPNFIPNFTLGFHRTAIFYGNSFNTLDFLNAFLPMGNYMGQDQLDQRASITVNWLFPEIGFNVYGEWARNDFSSTLRLLIRELQHSEAFTIGLRHIFLKKPTSILLYRLEFTETMHTIDYQTEVVLGRGTAGFYTHHIVQQGYTQNGQLLGAAIGPGSDSQYFGIVWYGHFGKLEGYLLRRSINKDYVYGQPDSIRYHSSGSFSVEATLGFNLDLILSPKIILTTEIATSWMIAWNYISLNDVFNIQLLIGSRIKL